MKSATASSLSAALVLCGCSKEPSNTGPAEASSVTAPQTKASAAPAVASVVMPTPSATELKPTKSSVVALVEKWNKAHALKTLAAFTNVYGDSVIYYRARKSGEECARHKVVM